VGPAFAEAFYKGEHCYLADPEWTRLYDSLAEETLDLTAKSPLVIRIRKALVRAPGLVANTSRAFSAEGLCDAGGLLILELRVREIHQNVQDCVKDYEVQLSKTSSSSPSASMSAIGRESFGSALECLCLYKRMLAALSEVDQLRLEIEFQSVASIMLKRHEEPWFRHSWVHTGIEQGFALAVQSTHLSWEETVSCQGFLEQRESSRRRWETFRCRLIGIEVSE
jgi:hypothetical protein